MWNIYKIVSNGVWCGCLEVWMLLMPMVGRSLWYRVWPQQWPRFHLLTCELSHKLPPCTLHLSIMGFLSHRIVPRALPCPMRPSHHPRNITITNWNGNKWQRELFLDAEQRDYCWMLNERIGNWDEVKESQDSPCSTQLFSELPFVKKLWEERGDEIIQRVDMDFSDRNRPPSGILIGNYSNSHLDLGQMHGIPKFAPRKLPLPHSRAN